jgi:hypothetical protein
MIMYELTAWLSTAPMCSDIALESDAESTHVAAADTTSAQRISQYEELFAF